MLRAWFQFFSNFKTVTSHRKAMGGEGCRQKMHPSPASIRAPRGILPAKTGTFRSPQTRKAPAMTTQTLARPIAQPASPPVLDRIFAAATIPAPANDSAGPRPSLLVRRRERARRRDAR